MKTRILLVDDDHGPMDYFVEALRHRNFEVKQVDSVDVFFAQFDRARTPLDFDLMVVDMMMPRGSRLTSEETDEGHRSGVLMVRAIRAKYPFLPIVVLSNYSEPQVLALLPSDVKFKAKFEISPFEFADFIKTLIPATP